MLVYQFVASGRDLYRYSPEALGYNTNSRGQALMLSVYNVHIKGPQTVLKQQYRQKLEVIKHKTKLLIQPSPLTGILLCMVGTLP